MNHQVVQQAQAAVQQHQQQQQVHTQAVVVQQQAQAAAAAAVAAHQAKDLSSLEQKLVQLRYPHHANPLTGKNETLKQTKGMF